MELTWYGQSAFRLAFDDAVILFDPFLSGSPVWDEGWEEPANGATHVLITHGHDDHLGDTLDIVEATGAMVVGGFEVCSWLGAKGAAKTNPGNQGGTVDCGAFTVTFVNALHSSSTAADGGITYLGNPLGLIVTPKSGGPPVYHMGDTGVFGDMALINELYAPKVGLVPIGDRFTMGAREAALACRRFFNFDTVVPCHYGTFEILDQTPDRFIEEMGDAAGVVRAIKIGETLAL